MFLPGTGGNGVLNSHPEIINLIADMLQNTRKTGCVVNGTVARAIIVGALQKLLPSVLAENGGRFKVSSSWVSPFCAEALGWSFRKGATAAQKLPNNFNEQGYMTILRLAYYACESLTSHHQTYLTLIKLVFCWFPLEMIGLMM